jgi:hypothetical protein
MGDKRKGTCKYLGRVFNVTASFKEKTEEDWD